MTTGEDLRQAYLKHRLSPAEVAQHFGIDRRTLSRWEKRLPEKAVPAVADFIDRLQTGRAMGPSLRTASDTQLLAEVADRLARLRAAADTYESRSDDVPAFVTESLERAHEHERREALG